MKPAVIVTGGAGYVGAHACAALAEAGFTPVTVDSLSNGHAAFVRFGPLERGDIRDRVFLDRVFATHRPAAVLHFAALIEVGQSVRDPAAFYDVNVRGALTLLEAMRAAGVGRIVFSSTCATYGLPQRLPLTEDHPQQPINPYGWTKLAVERAILDYGGAYGVTGALLRYFNAAGAHVALELGERHEPETHAIPLAIQAALGRRERFTIFGNDYETPDGTALRDYVHVRDLAAAHVLALRRLLEGGPTMALNLGAGAGVSVAQLVAAVERASGRTVPLTYGPRREGDSPALVADPGAAARLIGWRATRGIDEIVADAWRWHSEIEPRLFP